MIYEYQKSIELVNQIKDILNKDSIHWIDYDCQDIPNLLNVTGFVSYELYNFG